MAKVEAKNIDYSNLNLSEIIRRKTKRKCSFMQLDEYEKYEVLVYIKKHNIKMRIFGDKWYDILTDKFYALEYILYEDELMLDEHEFKSFGEFYDFFKEDIYDNSCFYGYEFTDEIANYDIDIKKINFNSRIGVTIDDLTFKDLYIKNEDNSKKARHIAKKMQIAFLHMGRINTLKKLQSVFIDFIKEFDSSYSKYVLISYLLRTQKEIIKDAFIEFVCKDCYGDAFFADLIFTYGIKDAKYVIDNYIGCNDENITRNKIKLFNDLLTCYQSVNRKYKRIVSFDKKIGMYKVEMIFYNFINHEIMHTEYFYELNELAKFLDNDFLDANFDGAPDKPTKFLKYKINENTNLPKSDNYVNIEIKKYYQNNKFYVQKLWLDVFGRVVLSCTKDFERFYDFVCFLKKDLSNADLIMCDGIENIAKLKNLNIKGLKVKSDAALKLGLSVSEFSKERYNLNDFEQTNQFELSTIKSFQVKRLSEYDDVNVKYISDVHLLHRFIANKCLTKCDEEYVIRMIVNNLNDQSSKINIIAGDTSSDFDSFCSFVNKLESSWLTNYFFVLGNHELWPFSELNYKNIIGKYRTFFSQKSLKNIYLLHNNIYFLCESFWHEISENELKTIDVITLRKILRGAKIILFGGIGFAGMNLIVVTHMPIEDWGGDISVQEGVVYINGHNHKNYYYDDGHKRIYADNQIGYKGKNVDFKEIFVDSCCDWFRDFEDGIYEIDKKDYLKFYRGINETINFNRNYNKLFMLKRENNYMFLMESVAGNLQILNGGAIKKAGNHDLEYFYNNLVNYSKSIKLFLVNYNETQKKISCEIKKIGGDGKIHGSIVDIDFYNHLYINPLDGKIIPYFAYSMSDKYVYNNFPSLLKFKCPELFDNFQQLLNSDNSKNALILYNSNLPIVKKTIHVESTEMYKISRIIKGLQYTTKYNIVRLWNDATVSEVSEENGQKIVREIINSNFALTIKNDNFNK